MREILIYLFLYGVFAATADAEIMEVKYTCAGKEYPDSGPNVTKAKLRAKIKDKHDFDPEGSCTFASRSIQAEFDNRPAKKRRSAKQWYRQNVDCDAKPTQEEKVVCRILKR